MKAVPNSSGFSKMNTTAFADAKNTYPIFAASKDEPWRIVLTSEQEKKSELKLEREKHQKLISHAVLGDILVKAGDHVVIIQNMNYPEDSEVLTDFNQVDVIHSAEGINVTGQTSIYKIIRSTAFQVSSQINLYQLRRLK